MQLIWYKVVDEATGGGGSTTNQNFVLKNNSKPLVVKSSRGDGRQRLDVVLGQGRDVGERWTLEEIHKGVCYIKSGSYSNHIFTGVSTKRTVHLQEKRLANALSLWTFVPAEDADPRHTPDGGASLTLSRTAPHGVPQVLEPSGKMHTFTGGKKLIIRRCKHSETSELNAGTSLGSAQSNQRKPVKGGRDGGRRRNP
ncbi:Os09g0304800 [Oryza sativa Japonica Group]|uniref:Os09g0304800 protein n=1 Tax=Oryza sativa subsp. japonica TaxID=39947 RepID=Q0J2T0_ORYSJ|nr:Os09g0304800 [Oryza sativa Japonica Group]|eukprot:NP_001062821.1 Os09g0304800 [Oryza sativa Japonica Group]